MPDLLVAFVVAALAYVAATALQVRRPRSGRRC